MYINKTLGFRTFSNDEWPCLHYNIYTQATCQVGHPEMWNNASYNQIHCILTVVHISACLHTHVLHLKVVHIVIG